MLEMADGRQEKDNSIDYFDMGLVSKNRKNFEIACIYKKRKKERSDFVTV